jgi:rhomboid protease GluP
MMIKPKNAPATYAIMAAIVIGALVQMAEGAWTDDTALAILGANRSYAYIHMTGEYWRLLTSMFLHGGALHLLTNLWGIFQLGTLYELMFGTRRYLLIYFVSGIVASVTSMMHIPIHGSSVGASGAIFGLLGAFVFSILRSPRWRHERGLVVQCVFWIVLNIAVGMNIAQIDNYAHIGGLIAGLLLGAVLPHRTPPPPPTRVIDVQPYEG